MGAALVRLEGWASGWAGASLAVSHWSPSGCGQGVGMNVDVAVGVGCDRELGDVESLAGLAGRERRAGDGAVLDAGAEGAEGGGRCAGERVRRREPRGRRGRGGRSAVREVV